MKSLGSRFGNVTRTLALIVVVSVSFAELASSQDSTEITALYGRGVHAFFAGNLSEAENALTEVINSGSTDPRAYYFRGLVRMRQGGECAGDQDFQLGAMFEARDPGRRYAIGNALQRIQGPERIALEQFRRQGRVDKVQERRGQVRARYENLRNREEEVLHQSDPVPLEQLSQPSIEIRRADQGAVTTPAPAVVTPTPQPAIDPTPANVIDPAPVDSVPAENAGNDLFGTEPAASPTVEEEKSQADDLFDEEPAAESADPFGETTAPAPTVTTPPAADPAPEPAAEATTEDPFGGSTDEAPAADPVVEEATEETTETSEDPFGGAVEETPAVETPEETSEESAEEAAETEDPFGGTESTDTEVEEADEAAEDAVNEEAVTEDPFGGSTEEATEDPFGSSDSTEGEADSTEGESTEEGEAESTEDAPADEADPFGDF